MGASPSNADFFYSRTTAWARFAFESEYVCELQVAPLFAFSIDVVFVGAAALFDAQVHDGADIRIESVEFGI